MFQQQQQQKLVKSQWCKYKSFLISLIVFASSTIQCNISEIDATLNILYINSIYSPFFFYKC